MARVLLDSPVPHLDRTFDYLVPAAMAQQALPGTRVMVRFGEQEMRGWIWERGATTTHIGRLSALRRVVSDLPVLPEGSRRLMSRRLPQLRNTLRRHPSCGSRQARHDGEEGEGQARPQPSHLGAACLERAQLAPL